MITENDSGAPDLGFSWRARKNGDVEVLREGAVVTMLRGRAARELRAKLDAADSATVQQLLARATGNYRRGNERRASAHPRNRTDT